MSRDGSSGGTIRMADISEKGVERYFIPGVSISADALTFDGAPWILTCISFSGQAAGAFSQAGMKFQSIE
jgi:hypothetical protein